MTAQPNSPSAKGPTAFWRSRIGRRLLISILAFSSLVTLSITVSDLYLEYRSGVSVIHERLRQIEVSYAASLGESLWNLDKRQIALQLRGIAELPDIRAVELRETTPGSPVRFAVTAEGNPNGPGEMRDIPVWCTCGGNYRTIGVLHVETTHDNLYRDILRRAQVILAGQAIKTFLVATFILFIVHRLVTRRLLELAGAIAGFTPGCAGPISLRRRERAPDEFDDVADSFTDMGGRLERYGADLKAANARMEAILDNIPDLAWIKDADGRFIAGNRPLATLHGCADPSDLVGRTDFDVSPHELAQAYRQDEQEVMRTRTTRRVEEWHVRGDGTLFPIETIRTPLYDGSGMVIGTVGIARDVTERRAMEEQLKSTALALETVISNMPGTLFRMRYSALGGKKLMMIDGGQLHGRRAEIEAMVAMSPEQFMDQFHPDDHDMLYRHVPQQLREKGFAEYTMRRREPDGSWRWARTWERVVESDGDGMITEGITLDVTDEMAAKDALDASNLRFRDLIHALPVGVFEDEPGKGCVYSSEVWSTITGLTPEELLGTGWTRAVHPDDLPRVAAQWQQDIEARAVHHNEFRLVHMGDGHVTWVLARAVPRLDRNGALLGYIGSITDISARKLYEVSLERLNHVLKMVAVGNEALMQQSDKMSVFSAVCRVLTEMGGYPLVWIGLAEQDEHRTVRTVAADGAALAYMDGIQVRWDETAQGFGPTGQAIRTGHASIVDDIAIDPSMLPWRDKARQFGLRSAISLPLKAQDAVVGCLNLYSGEEAAFTEEQGRALQDFAHNIAFTVLAMRERRRREEVERHLQQAQKMEALGLLAGSVAHDFNNLLGAIQGFAGFIAEDTAEDEPASYYAQRILTASKRGKTLIGQILSFSRQLEMKREVFVPADLIAETTALLTASVPATSTVTVETDPETPALVGDRDLLGQALFNLCTNANDALGGHPGTISIKTHPTDLTRPELSRVPEGAGSATNVWEDGDGGIHAATGSFDPARQCVSLVVSDTGCGMDRSVVEKIFVPFFSTKQHDHGTGLGLAAVHRTVVAHQGAVLVHSRPGGGSTFELILPCDDRLVPQQPKDQPARPAATPVGGRILLVDDNQDFGDMLLAALERRGFDVSPCSDPRDALDGIKEFPEAWHVMITDQTMPHMSGLELIRSAKAVQPDLVCFLCTGYAEDALDDATLAEAGAVALLRKPVDIDDLVEKLTPYLPH